MNMAQQQEDLGQVVESSLRLELIPSSLEIFTGVKFVYEQDNSLFPKPCTFTIKT